MNKTVALVSLSIVISILSFMNHPMVMATSVDTKVILTIIFFIGAINVALFVFGVGFNVVRSFIGKTTQSSRFNKFLSAPNNIGGITGESKASFEVPQTTPHAYNIDLYAIGEAIHNFGDDPKYFKTDENGYILVSPDAVSTIRACGSDIRVYVGHIPDKNVFKYIANKLHDACHYNNLHNKGEGCATSTHC